MNASLEPNWVLIGCFIIPLTWLFHYQLDRIGGSQIIYRTGPLHSVIVSLYHKLLLGALPIVLLLYQDIMEQKIFKVSLLRLFW